MKILIFLSLLLFATSTIMTYGLYHNERTHERTLIEVNAKHQTEIFVLEAQLNNFMSGRESLQEDEF